MEAGAFIYLNRKRLLWSVLENTAQMKAGRSSGDLTRRNTGLLLDCRVVFTKKYKLKAKLGNVNQTESLGNTREWKQDWAEDMQWEKWGWKNIYRGRKQEAGKRQEVTQVRHTQGM